MNNKINPSDEAKIRLEKLKMLQNEDISPYPKHCERTHEISEIIEDFKKLEKGNKKLTLVGRLRMVRSHGNLTFAHIEDESGKIQIALSKKEIGDTEYKQFTKLIDVGDFVEISGTCFVTHKGENSIMVNKWKLLTKSLLPLPEKWHGLSDTETRFRKRYLDLLSNPKVKEIFYTRSKVIQFIRNYFLDEGFLEVDTPILQTVASGAIAEPFKTYHKALDTELYLRIAPELFLKELIIGGYEKVFEIARCFRNEGIDYTHNPEFTQIEFYWAYKEYNFLMEYMEKFMEKMVKEVTGNLTVVYDNQKIDFKGPYKKVDFREAILKETKIDLDKEDEKSLQKVAKKKGLKVDKSWGVGKIADELFKEFVRPKMINPTYIINHPIELSPLAKKLDDRPNYVERFQLIIGGRIELMNAFTELNDPIDQEERFKFQQSLNKKGDREAMKKDDAFIEALKYGMPPTTGLGMGIDRLVNVLTGTHNIKEVILFPTLKPKK
ncbi:lysine--tRNA ligase [bacterium]|nr:lysine--tRNA ligase [bacterium]